MSALDNIPATAVISASTPFVKALLDEIIVPKLANFKKKLTLSYQKGHVITADHFTEYLIRTYQKIASVNTIAFSNRQLYLKDVYLPLTLKATGNDKTKYKMTGYPADLLEKFKRVLITDVAGMGKSTLVKRLFIDVLEKHDSIPLFIELRNLNRANGLLNEIYSQLNSLTDSFNKDLLSELFESGQFVFLLDGYDEITLADRKDVTADIQSFISRTPKNKFILTSRPENALYSFGDFKELSIQPMSKSEAYKLIENYGESGEISDLLIEKLDSDEIYPHVKDFLINPLLVTLLFTAFDFKRIIPFKKHVFYRQIFDAYFDDHDLTKGDFVHEKYSKLDSDDFHRMLRYIGFVFMREQQSHCTKDELLRIIAESKVYQKVSVVDSAFFKDLITTVPLFMQDGNHIRWSHKSLQEYFAAQFIYLDAKEEQANILHTIYHHINFDKFLNVLELFCDIDPKTFRNVILYQHLKTFKSHFEQLFIDIPNYFDDDSRKAIKERKELTFLITAFMSITRIKYATEDGNLTDTGLQEFHSMRKKAGQFYKSIAFENEYVKYQVYLYRDQRMSLNDLLLARQIPGFFKNHEPQLDNCRFYESNVDKKKPEFFEINDNQSSFCNTYSFNISHTNAFIKSGARNMVLIESVAAFRLLEEIEDDLNKSHRALSSF